jgi:hypothetical protein
MATKHISDLDVCKAYIDGKDSGKLPYELLMERTGQCEKVCVRAMERSCERGLIEYGAHLRTCGVYYALFHRPASEGSGGRTASSRY